ncbi:hypothetical protein D0859_04212 [Hortaea werneckii]|uniref:BTB domain-containing protein n=1 Tax=Hortaea werneckii TaxID=91943 RepID=A0A3M7J1Y1_HORWE|nr:hypothetical protein D0859_04212 [Hortaea werneckii]
MASSTNNIDAGDETIAFKCEECVVNVHGAAVCAKSNVIKAMVDAASTDSSNARTIITGFDPHTVVRMLRYVYDGDYDLREAVELPTASGSVHGKEHPVVSHIRVHAIGKRYEVSGLAALALEKLRCSETYIAAKNFVNVLRVAYQYSAKETDDVRTELFAVALAKMEDLAASQVFLTQLAEFEELRDFAAQLLPHVFKFAAVRYSRSEDSLALKNETIQLLATEASTHNARADIHIEKFCAMREKYEGELIKGERLEKLLTERSNQLEVATAKIACLESAPSQDTAQGDASEAEIFRLQELLKAEQARAARTQTHLDQSDLKVRGCEGKIQGLESQVRGCEAKIKRLQSHVRGCEGKLHRWKSAARDWLGMVKNAKTEFLMLQQQAGEYQRERDEAREKLHCHAEEAVSVSDAFKGINDLVEKVNHCRHCGRPQNCKWWMEWDGSDRARPAGLTFRCGDCTTKHW